MIIILIEIIIVNLYVYKLFYNICLVEDYIIFGFCYCILKKVYEMY